MSSTWSDPTTVDEEARASEVHTDMTLNRTFLDTGDLQKNILNNPNFAVIATDAMGVIQTFNAGAERMLGYAAGDMINRKTFDALLDSKQLIDLAKALSAEFATAIKPDFGTLTFTVERGMGDRYDLDYVRKDGSRFPAHMSITRLRDDKVEIIGYLIIANDDSAARLATDAVKRGKDAQEMFRLAVEASPSGMLMVDREGKIVIANAAIERQFGYHRDELIGQASGHAGPGALAQSACPFPRGVQSSAGDAHRRSPPPSYWVCARMAAEFPVEVSLNPLHVDGNLMVLAVVVDITERKRIERLKDEFVATVSHELRTPLTSITGALGLLAGNAAGKLPESAIRLLTIAYTNSQRLVRLLDDILDIEKMVSGKVVFKFTRVDVRSLVEQTIEANHGFANGCDVRIRLDAASEAFDVRADPDRLAQAITNLLSNAIKFSPPGDEVVVAIETRGDTIRISVRDHGHGVPDEFKPRIFEKFAQADTTDARQKGGTGLGLSIVKQIVDRLDGAVGFEDAPSGGAIFYIDLPEWAHESRFVSKAHLRVLLCEDDPEAAIVLVDRLRQGGFLADVALTASEAVRRAAATSYAAILVDLRLPKGDGIDLIKRLRGLRQIYNTLLVVLSADLNLAHDEQQPSTLLNILDWLDAPIDVARLVRVLDRPIAHNGNKRPRILHVDSNQELLRVVARALGAKAEVMSVDSIDEARRALAANRFDVAVLDVALAMGSGFELLHELHDGEGNAIPLIVFSPEADDLAIATAIRSALIKSRTSVDNLLATLRKRLVGNSPASSDKDAA